MVASLMPFDQGLFLIEKHEFPKRTATKPIFKMGNIMDSQGRRSEDNTSLGWPSINFPTIECGSYGTYDDDNFNKLGSIFDNEDPWVDPKYRSELETTPEGITCNLSMYDDTGSALSVAFPPLVNVNVAPIDRTTTYDIESTLDRKEFTRKEAVGRALKDTHQDKGVEDDDHEMDVDRFGTFLDDDVDKVVNMETKIGANAQVRKKSLSQLSKKSTNNNQSHVSV